MRVARLAVAAAMGLLPSVAALAEEGNWPAIREALFAGRELKDGTGMLALEAPDRAHDAAVVPVTIRTFLPHEPGDYVKAVHLVVDENPAPLAGVFRFFPESGGATISTRIRVNAYTNVHAVAETSDGELYVVERFVKAAGGCSAPALKDKEVAMTRLGKMKLKPTTPFASGEVNEAQLLISHPNYTGLQIDQLTRNWIPPDYVRKIEVSYGGTPVLAVEGDISISEDPAITFSFVPDGPAPMSVRVEDSRGRTFEGSWSIGPTS